jgi:hypothetical protein
VTQQLKEKSMSLEAKLELLTAAVIELTAAIGAMQAPGPVASEDAYKEALKDRTGGERAKQNQAAVVEQEIADAKKSDAKSTDTTAGKPSAPTGESSSPALDYVKDVKPITIQLSKEKGREITIGVLSRFGVKSAQDLDTTQWAEYIAHCKKVLAGGEV